MDAPQATYGIAHVEFRRTIFGAYGFFRASARGVPVFIGFIRYLWQMKIKGLFTHHAPGNDPTLSESFTLFYGILR